MYFQNIFYFQNFNFFFNIPQIQTILISKCPKLIFWHKLLAILCNFKHNTEKQQQKNIPLTLQTAILALIIAYLQMHPSLHLPISIIFQCIFKIFQILFHFQKFDFVLFLNIQQIQMITVYQHRAINWTNVALSEGRFKRSSLMGREYRPLQSITY